MSGNIVRGAGSGCPFCEYPLTNSNSTECKGCKKDVKAYWGNKLGHETAAEIIDRHTLIKARRKTWMDEEFPFPDRPRRGKAYLLSVMMVIAAIPGGTWNLWIGAILFVSGSILFGVLELKFRSEATIYSLAEEDYEKYQRHMAEKRYLR